MPERAERLPSEVFDLPVEKMRDGYYSDAYFVFTKARSSASSTTRTSSCRSSSATARCSAAWTRRSRCCASAAAAARPTARGCPAWDELEVHALHDGDEIEPWETVLTIEGDYSLFCHLETVYLGALARRTLISRNVREVVEAANGKPILYFPARHDHHRVQTGDGYAAHIAGAIGVSTDAQASWWGGRGAGTVPHGLIAAYGGDTVRAAQRFAATYPELDIVVLVDFENDSVRTAVEVAHGLGTRLWGVRLDTSGHDGRPCAVGRDGPLRPARRQSAARRGRCARRSTARASPTSASSSRAASRWTRSARSRRPASRSTPTASARA